MNMEKPGYNGWSNYETWARALWWDNDGGTQRHLAGIVEDAIDKAISDGEADIRKVAVDSVESILQELHEDEREAIEIPTCFFSDMLSAVQGEINFREIAENLITNVELFCAGWNMPGYLPDSEPAVFSSFDSAREYILEALENAAEFAAQNGESTEETEVLEESDEAKKWVQAQRSEFSVVVGNYSYWITKE